MRILPLKSVKGSENSFLFNSHVVEEIFSAILPNQSQLGVDKDKLFPLIEKNQFEIISQKKDNEILYLVMRLRP